MRTNETIRIVPAVVPSQKESAGVSQAKCRHEWEECECAGYTYWCQRCLIPGMTVNAAITPGAAIYTVGPDGRPNGNTARIGCGTVLSLHREIDGTGEEKDYAYVLFDDGKRGSWPVEQLRAQHDRRGNR